MKSSNPNKNCIYIIVVCIVGLIFSNTTFLLKKPVMAEEVLSEQIEENVQGLFIPLSNGLGSESVEMVSDFESVRVSVPCNDKNYYYENSLKGDGQNITELKYGYADGTSVFDIHFSGVCECSLEDAEGGVNVLIEPLSKKYKKVIVIDPTHGGDDAGTVSYSVKESYVNLKIAQALKEKLSSDEVGVFLTRNDEQNVDSEDRKALVTKLNADFVLQIECRGDAKTRTTFGPEFFVFSNTVGFDVKALESGNIKFKNDGTVADDYDLPGILISAGYLTNKMDADNLCDDVYVDSISSQIKDAVEEYIWKTN